MKAYTFWDEIKDILYRKPIGKIEYYFAKRWLNKNFGYMVGKQDYWGDFLAEKFTEIKK